MAPAQKLGQDLLCEGGKRGEERERKEGDLAWVSCVARVLEKRLSELALYYPSLQKSQRPIPEEEIFRALRQWQGISYGMSTVAQSMPVYLHIFAGSQKKLQLALCGLTLPTLLELVKSHNTCYLQPRIPVSFRHLQVVLLPRIPTFDLHGSITIKELAGWGNHGETDGQGCGAEITLHAKMEGGPAEI